MIVYVVFGRDWENGWIEATFKTRTGAERRKARLEKLNEAGRVHKECGPNIYSIYEERVIG